jgi:hypothetical protein
MSKGGISLSLPRALLSSFIIMNNVSLPVAQIVSHDVTQDNRRRDLV